VSEAANPPVTRLNALLAEAGLAPLDAAQSQAFEDYLSLLLRWNARVNLTAIRDQEGILRRHFVESIACARALPAGVRSLLDFGSGAGFPGIPIALCRPEIAVTLAESQGKKAAFLREAVRQLGLADRASGARMKGTGFSPYKNADESTWALAPEGRSSAGFHAIPMVPAGCTVHSARAEVLRTVFDCVTLRAVDRMELAVQAAAQLLRPGGWLALLTTTADLPALQSAAGADFSWPTPLPQPGGEDRLLALGVRSSGFTIA
jgi:16S rRNA (guanine527-N7)-methyltransferase